MSCEGKSNCDDCGQCSCRNPELVVKAFKLAERFNASKDQEERDHLMLEISDSMIEIGLDSGDLRVPESYHILFGEVQSAELAYRQKCMALARYFLASLYQRDIAYSVAESAETLKEPPTSKTPNSVN